MVIQQKLSTWGNSLGIRLSQAIAQQVGFTEGALISISVESGKIVLALTKPKYKLDELLADITPDVQHDELDWGEPVGEETW